MTEQQAIKYLFCSGMSELQVNTVVKAIREPYIKAIEAIRADMTDFAEDEFHRPNTDYEAWAAIRTCLNIIDKYDPEKAEKE